MLISEFSGKRVAILGTGREGRSAYEWLGKNLPDLAITLIDETSPGPEMQSVLRSGDRLIVEPLSAQRLSDFDVLNHTSWTS